MSLKRRRSAPGGIDFVIDTISWLSSIRCDWPVGSAALGRYSTPMDAPSEFFAHAPVGGDTTSRTYATSHATLKLRHDQAKAIHLFLGVKI